MELNSQSTIYLDYASTTPVDPRVASKMMEYLTPQGELVIRHHDHIDLDGLLMKQLRKLDRMLLIWLIAIQEKSFGLLEQQKQTI